MPLTLRGIQGRGLTLGRDLDANPLDRLLALPQLAAAGPAYVIDFNRALALETRVPLAGVGAATAGELAQLRAVAMTAALANHSGPAKLLLGRDGNFAATVTDEAPIDWSNGKRQLLLEEARTNQVTSSTSTTSGAWSGSGLVSIGQSRERGGLLLQAFATTGVQFPSINTLASVAMANGERVAVSQYVMAGTAGNCRVHCNTPSGNIFVLFQISGGVVSLGSPGNNTGGAWAHGSNGVVDLGGGLYRLWMVIRNNSGSAAVITVRPHAGIGDFIAHDLAIWLGGVQAEIVAGDDVPPSSLIVTTGAAATRPADSCQLSNLLQAVRAAGHTVFAWRHGSTPVTLSSDTLDNGYWYDGLAAFHSSVDTSAIEALTWDEL
ncbi:phage head spike fiber domain-containing protein [Polymorphum gilvum]|uniref:Uncharacterized protein n=1 Tax=Polymorphum gilvum (strain LMG 25793 / CGMCC 1.9160 / SL003B-26A1) TaxID=991905 RepID=F2J5N3_POLGS|nr:hypothetical protein [Polymorphum gilvum]ADZ70117.1 hypothetical protein SL003B_1689 [Polymorphum gilvum SL003B-26A1]